MNDFGMGKKSRMEAALEAFAQTVAEGDVVGEYQKRAQRRAWQRVTGSVDISFTSSLRMELAQVKSLDAARAGDAAAAMQRAVATYGAYLAKRENVQRLSHADVERVHLVQIRQERNVIWLGLPAAPPDQLPIPGQRSADVALKELLEYLPQSSADQSAVTDVLAARQPIRKAVDEIAAVGAEYHSAVSLCLLDGKGAETYSYLSADAASDLHSLLSVPTARTRPEEMRGVVDGMRTSRATLYLLRDNGREVSVHIEAHQRQQVIDLIRHQVVISVLARTLESASGAQSRKAYRLVSISDVNESLL